MRRLIIIVEGDSEQGFVDKVLSPYFGQRGITAISCYKIKKTNGGLTNYEHLRKDLMKAVHEENVFVTTLVDFYALPPNFPRYEEAKKIQDKGARLTFLENAIVEDIAHGNHLPFLKPYIQLHEFEAFTFTNMKGFESYFSEQEADMKGLRAIVEGFENPEDINENKETAPSKRLKQLIRGYSKVVDGNNIIAENGLTQVLSKCSRFRQWTEIVIAGVIN